MSRLQQLQRGRSIRALEALTLTSATLVTILTYLMVGSGQVSEFNPVTSALIDAGGFYTFAAVRLGAVALAFTIIVRVAADADGRPRAPTIALAGAGAAALVTSMNALTDAYATLVLGLPETVVLSEVATFIAVVSISSLAWFARGQLLEAIIEIPSPRTPSRQTLAVTFTVLMVGFAFAPFAGGFGALEADHDGLALAGDDIDDEIHVGEWTDLTTYDAQTGEPLESANLGDPDDGVISPDGDVLYYLNDDGGEEIIAWDIETESEIWSLDVASANIWTNIEISPDGEHLYFTSVENFGKLTTGGSLVWENSIKTDKDDDPAWGGLAVGPDEDAVYVGDVAALNEEIHAVDPSDGSEIWRADYQAETIAVSPHNDRVFTGDDHLAALDPTDGSEIWFEDVSAIRTSDVSLDGETLAVGDSAGDLSYYDTNDGTLLDSVGLDADGNTLSARWSPNEEGRIYAVANDGVYGIQDREIEWNDANSDASWVTLGQQPEIGEAVSGTVTDTDGDPIEGATVTAGEDSATTDSAGTFELSVDDPGTYDITANADGYETKTREIDVPEGGRIGVNFELRDAGSYSVFNEDGEPLDSDRPVTMRAYPAEDHDDPFDQPLSYWEDIDPAIETDSSTLEFEDLDRLDEPHVITYRPDNSGLEDAYASRAVYVPDVAGDWTLTVYPGMTTTVNVGINDKTGEWPRDDVTIRAEAVGETRDVVDRAALEGDISRPLSLYNNVSIHEIYAERDDGAERYLGDVTGASDMQGDSVIFDILSPQAEFNETFDEEEQEDLEEWENEEDIHYPPIASVSADIRDPIVGETVTFDATGSRAFSDASISTYDWTLPDGSSATGATAGWTPDSDDAGGAHTATVEVTDSEGSTDTASMTVFVASEEAERTPPPFADAEVVTDSPTVDEPVVLESISSADAGIQSIEWDTNDDGQFTETGDSVEVVPDESGIKSVGIRVTDENDVSDTFYVSFFVGANIDESAGFGGGSSGGGSGFVPESGSGGTGSTVVLGGLGVAGYALWRRQGGPGVVAGARRAAPVAGQALSSAGSLATGAVRRVASALGRLVGRS